MVFLNLVTCKGTYMIDWVGRTVRGSFHTIQGSFDTLGGFFDTIHGSFDTILGSFDTIQGSFDTIQGSFDTLLVTIYGSFDITYTFFVTHRPLFRDTRACLAHTSLFHAVSPVSRRYTALLTQHKPLLTRYRPLLTHIGLFRDASAYFSVPHGEQKNIFGSFGTIQGSFYTKQTSFDMIQASFATQKPTSASHSVSRRIHRVLLTQYIGFFGHNVGFFYDDGTCFSVSQQGNIQGSFDSICRVLLTPYRSFWTQCRTLLRRRYLLQRLTR